MMSFSETCRTAIALLATACNHPNIARNDGSQSPRVFTDAKRQARLGRIGLR
jgi:hypothetical protein